MEKMISTLEKSSMEQEKGVETLLTYCLINSTPIPEFDEITKSASIIFDTPISAIGLIDHSTLKFKSKVGITSELCDKDLTFCNYTIKDGDLFVVDDSLVDERFKNNQMLLGSDLIRFYAGVALTTPTGFKIGTLFIADIKPRSLNEDQKLLLKAMGKQVIPYFEIIRQKEEIKILVEKNNDLLRKNDDFCSKMSHELRTPLNILTGSAQILSESPLNFKQTEIMKLILSSVEILDSLVNDVFDYAKIETGTLKLENRPFKLKKFLKGMFQIHRDKAKQKNIYSEIIINKNIPSYVNGDINRLHQILKNLLNNAIKFTKDGSIKLNVDIMSESKEEVEIKFCVQDTGMGISQDKIDMIFEKYDQVEGATRVYGGVGLGLFIVKNLIELKHGKLHVNSELGKGSEFIFSLKFKISNEEEIAELLKTEKQEESYLIENLRDKKILVAEDNLMNVKLIEKQFEGTGVHLDFSENGKVCIEKLNENSYDLILMDLYMPEMDGYETTKYVRQTLKLDIPILAFSANIVAENKEKCLKEGMNDYVTKPFKLKDLLNTMVKCLHLHKLMNLNEEYAGLSSNEINKKEPLGEVEDSPDEEKTELNISKTLPNPGESIMISERMNLEIFKEYTEGDEDFEESLIQIFLEEIPEYFNELWTEISRQNLPKIRKAAHKLKSPLAIFGYFNIIQKLVNIEKQCKIGEREILKESLESRQHFDFIIKEMKILYESYKESNKAIEKSNRKL